MGGALAAMLPDGRRLHLQHGPIDLIVEVFGTGRRAAYDRATRRFQTLLQELVDELPALRDPATTALCGTTARRMLAAISPLADDFITPMAAVAGAVADEILAQITSDPGVTKAYVNNGGDIAIYLAPGQSFTAALAATPPARAEITAGMNIHGIATSGWRGRSHSLGIADSVTVLTHSAATADAAATLIANAVDLPGHGQIIRTPAQILSPDSDLGQRAVTTEVPLLTAAERAAALQNGLIRAQRYLSLGLIKAAHLTLQGDSRSLALATLQEPTHA